jgi:hypothetical protein
MSVNKTQPQSMPQAHKYDNPEPIKMCEENIPRNTKKQKSDEHMILLFQATTHFHFGNGNSCNS